MSLFLRKKRGVNFWICKVDVYLSCKSEIMVCAVYEPEYEKWGSGGIREAVKKYYHKFMQNILLK